VLILREREKKRSAGSLRRIPSEEETERKKEL
jgi:hypothetical protein